MVSITKAVPIPDGKNDLSIVFEERTKELTIPVVDEKGKMLNRILFTNPMGKVLKEVRLIDQL